MRDELGRDLGHLSMRDQFRAMFARRFCQTCEILDDTSAGLGEIVNRYNQREYRALCVHPNTKYTPGTEPEVWCYIEAAGIHGCGRLHDRG